MHEVGASAGEAGVNEDEVESSKEQRRASEPEDEACDNEVGTCDDEGLARFGRVVCIGRVTESITLALRGGAITLITP